LRNFFIHSKRNNDASSGTATHPGGGAGSDKERESALELVWVHEHGPSLGDVTHRTAGLEEQVPAEPVP